MAKTWRVTGQAVPSLQTVDDAMQSFMTQNDVPNGAMAIARGERLVFARGYTWDEPGAQTAQPTSLFRTASCTKSLTSILAYRLQDDGMLDAENRPGQPSANVQDILQLTTPGGGTVPSDPAPPSPKPGFYFPSVTVEHLLTHMGGWAVTTDDPTYYNDQVVADAFKKGLPVTRMEIARWAASQKMDRFPGTEWAYSNFGFMLLGLVIERVTGQDYMTALRQRVLAPLGITRPRLAMPLERSRAPGEVAYHAQVPDACKTFNGVGCPDFTGENDLAPVQYGGENHLNFSSFGGLVMSAPDYVRVLAAYAGANPPTQTAPLDMIGDWGNGDIGGTGAAWHGGGMPGTLSYIATRDDDVSLVVFFNKDVPVTFTWKNVETNHQELWHEIANALPAADWPGHDLFPSVMTPAVKPGPEKLNIYVSGTDTVVREASWEQNVAEGRWRGWWQVRRGSAPPGAPVTVVSRHRDKLDAFLVADDGAIYTAAWQAGAAVERWSGWWPVLDGRAAPGSRVSAVSRHPDKLDIFVVGAEGGVWTAAWERDAAAGQWQGWWPIGSLGVQPGSPVTAVARGDKLDVFAVDGEGKVRHAAWFPGSESWLGWWPVLGGRAAPGSMVNAVSRHPDKLDIFVVGTDGRVWTAAWEGKVPGAQWQGWWPIGSVQANVGSPVGAVARSDKLDIFVVSKGGEIRHAAWVAGGESWLGWWPVLGGRAAPGSLVSAVSRHPDRLDAFVVGTDGGVWTAAWEGKSPGAQWRGWWRIGDQVVPAAGQVGVVTRTLS